MNERQFTPEEKIALFSEVQDVFRRFSESVGQEMAVEIFSAVLDSNQRWSEKPKKPSPAEGGRYWILKSGSEKWSIGLYIISEKAWFEDGKLVHVVDWN